MYFLCVLSEGAFQVSSSDEIFIFFKSLKQRDCKQDTKGYGTKLTWTVQT